MRAGLPFAARVQALLIVTMFAGLLLIGQQANKSLYQIGLPLLIVSAFLQIAFGNIAPQSGLLRSLKLVAITAVIVGAVFVLSVLLAPTLIDMTR